MIEVNKGETPTEDTKAKKIVAQLIALEGKKKSALADEAHALALEGRRARAERYMSWRTGWSALSG